MTDFDTAYVLFIVAIVGFVGLCVLFRMIVASIARREIRKFLKGYVISRRGRGGRFTSIR
jgi:hypothetical protein